MVNRSSCTLLQSTGLPGTVNDSASGVGGVGGVGGGDVLMMLVPVMLTSAGTPVSQRKSWK